MLNVINRRGRAIKEYNQKQLFLAQILSLPMNNRRRSEAQGKNEVRFNVLGKNLQVPNLENLILESKLHMFYMIRDTICSRSVLDVPNIKHYV